MTTQVRLDIFFHHLAAIVAHQSRVQPHGALPQKLHIVAQNVRAVLVEVRPDLIARLNGRGDVRRESV